jgi:hypothetical protein
VKYGHGKWTSKIESFIGDWKSNKPEGHDIIIERCIGRMIVGMVANGNMVCSTGLEKYAKKDINLIAEYLKNTIIPLEDNGKR